MYQKGDMNIFIPMLVLLLSVSHITLMFYICYKLAGKTGIITRCLKGPLTSLYGN